MRLGGLTCRRIFGIENGEFGQLAPITGRGSKRHACPVGWCIRADGAPACRW
jgi:hypothetical protein